MTWEPSLPTYWATFTRRLKSLLPEHPTVPESMKQISNARIFKYLCSYWRAWGEITDIYNNP